MSSGINSNFWRSDIATTTLRMDMKTEINVNSEDVLDLHSY